MTKLWKIDQGKLLPVETARQAAENELENWIVKDPEILGLNLLLIGRQIPTAFGGKIDLLGIDEEGNLAIVELKRDRTPREVVAQVLDYASWVSHLTTKDVHELAMRVMGRPLKEAFYAHFETTPPETLNANHSMVIVAAALDPSSERIVQYLAERWDIAINTAFFQIFDDGGQRYLSANWLMDQQEVVERSASRVRAPWTGLWFANVGDGTSRSWSDMRKYGFIAAGGGQFYSGRLKQLRVGDPVVAYQKQRGYVGYGQVTGEAKMAKDVIIDGKNLLELPLVQPALAHDKSDPEQAEYVVTIEWKEAVPLEDAKTFKGAFANQNIVCKLRDAETIEFLRREFDIPANE